MDALKPIIRLAATLTTLLALGAPAAAQDGTLEALTPASGLIEPGGEGRWTFTAASGEVLSFLAAAKSGDLDPAITITASDGSTLISEDDTNYPNNTDTLLEAITFPRRGTYTATVRSVNGTSGDYTLTMQPGFAEVHSSLNFNGPLEWEPLTDALTVEAASEQLALTLEGGRQTGIAVHPDLNVPTVYYAQVTVNVINGNEGWVVGMSARQQSAARYYLLSINQQGQYRFDIQTVEGRRTLHDWTPHPAIVPGQTTFRLAMLVNGSGFDFFYNGQFFGRLSDSILRVDGTIGLALETGSSESSRTTARFDDLIVTIPAMVEDTRVRPGQLTVSTPNDMVQELQRRGLIPAGGEMALTVNESFVESRLPGVQQIPLARGEAYLDFAIGTTINWQALAAGMTGCGLVMRAADETNFMLAYLDQTGGYGVSQREGDSYTSGIFGELADMSSGSHHLLVIARGDELIYYVDGRYSGVLRSEATAGGIGNAVINFEPISTSCQFTNTWLWRWDEG